MMRFQLLAVFGGLLVAGSVAAQQKTTTMKIRMVIHGGAGTIERRDMTAANEEAHRAGLEKALQAGYDILKKNGSSLDAVEAAIRVLEDNPLFNAGKGAVFTHEGTNELDSSIMDGRTLNAGAVAGVKHIRNPICLARLVMDKVAARHARWRRRGSVRETRWGCRLSIRNIFTPTNAGRRCRR